MGVAAHALDEMRSDRDHRLAMALLTKSRYTLPPQSEKDNSESTSSSSSSGNKDAEQAPLCVSQPVHRPPLPSASRSASPRKRRAAALAAFEALHSVNATSTKRQRLAELSISSSNTTSSAGRDTITTSPQRLPKGIVRRSDSAAGERSQPGRLRSLQFALQDLSSADTKYLLKTLTELPHDIARLNATGGNISSSQEAMQQLEATSTQVFGWRNCFLCPRPSADSTTFAGNVIWKARKTFEATAMEPLAAKVWDLAKTLSQQPPLTKVCRWEQVYKVSKSVRVVRSVDCLFGRDERETIWLECLIDRGDHLCIGRRQLVRFRDYELDEAATIGECEGFLFRPHLTKLKVESEGSNSVEVDTPARLMEGSTLQVVSSIAPRGLSAEQLLRNLIAELPQFTLQWEEAVVHDLLPQIKF